MKNPSQLFWSARFRDVSKEFAKQPIENLSQVVPVDGKIAWNSEQMSLMHLPLRIAMLGFHHVPSCSISDTFGVWKLHEVSSSKVVETCSGQGQDAALNVPCLNHLPIGMCWPVHHWLDVSSGWTGWAIPQPTHFQQHGQILTTYLSSLSFSIHCQDITNHRQFTQIYSLGYFENKQPQSWVCCWVYHMDEIYFLHPILRGSPMPKALAAYLKHCPGIDQRSKDVLPWVTGHSEVGDGFGDDFGICLFHIAVSGGWWPWWRQ